MNVRTTVQRPTMQKAETMDDEVHDTVPSFPYSHRRSDSTYSLAPARRQPLRRNNSVVRTGKEIIPLVLTTEVAAAEQQQAQPQRNGHRRGLSIGLRNNSAAPAPAQQPKARPTSMFFDRFFNDASGERRYIPSPPQATRTSSSSSTTTVSSACRTCQCTSRSPSKSNESRYLAQIANFEAERETKDLTISMLSEQLLDKSQEIELLRCKITGLERALSGPDAVDGLPPLPSDIPLPSGRDSAIGTAESSSPALSHAFPSPRTPSLKQHTDDNDGVDDVDALRDENAALKAEIARLNAALDDGLGALCDLGL